MVDISSSATPDPMVMAEIGRRLRRLRDTLGLNQAEAAQRAGLDRSTVSRAEQGDNPTLHTLIRLLRVYGRMDALETFIPVAEVSPMALIRRQQKAHAGRVRSRASGRGAQPPADDSGDG